MTQRQETISCADFLGDLPVADIAIGPNTNIRIYGDASLDPPLVEMKLRFRGMDGVLNLTTAQAESIASGLTAAIAKARGSGEKTP
jgi:hypothetical protein